jgi:pentatricopeptide repeat protein
MDQVHKENGENDNLIKPNVSSFTSLIDAYAQTNDWDGVSASERMLNRLLEQFLEEGDESLEPNVASWTIVISAWTRLARKNFNKCAEKADRLLRRMEELYQEGRTSVAPDVITYITVMNAHAADSKSPGNARKAQDILDEMNERYLDGEDDMKVSTKSIKVVIDAWIKTNDPNAMDQAEAVLEMYEDMDEFQEPADDEIVQDIYRSMLFGFTKHKDPHRAEEYLSEMVSLGLKPDCFCYDRVIEAYTQLNGPDSFERTCAVFELMEQCRKDGDVMPNERVYTSFIRALTKAKVKGLARKATTVLKKMNELHQQGNRSIKPTTFTYNAVLNACADSINDDDSDNMEAFKVAIGIFNDLRNDGNDGPDHVTFGNMLRCAALLPEGEQRDTVITSTFQLCCKTGFVNSYVIRDLQYACSNEELWRRLVKCPQGDVDCDELPASWKSAYERKQEKAFRRENDNRKAGGGGRGGRRPSFGGRPEKFSRERR